MTGGCRGGLGVRSWPVDARLHASKLRQIESVPVLSRAKGEWARFNGQVPIAPDQLPDDAQALKRIIAAMAQDALTAQAEIARLKFRLARYRRTEFGRSSEHLKAFRGTIHADGYAGFNELFAGNRITEAACWAHVRRKFFDVHAATGSSIAKEALDRIGQLYRTEETINGTLPDDRRRERQQRSKPIAEALRTWAEETARKLSRKSELAAAFRYMRARWTALVRCFDDGRLALDNNAAERPLRGVAIGRKNYLFAGSDAGGRRAAAVYALIETAKLNGLNPQLYIADVLARIGDHPARHIADLLPWNWKPIEATGAAA